MVIRKLTEGRILCLAGFISVSRFLKIFSIYICIYKSLVYMNLYINLLFTNAVMYLGQIKLILKCILFFHNHSLILPLKYTPSPKVDRPCSIFSFLKFNSNFTDDSCQDHLFLFILVWILPLLH